MDWLTDRRSFGLAVILYGVSVLYSVLLWRKGFRTDNRTNYILLLMAFVFHSLAMFLRGFSFQRCPIYNLYEMTTFISWTMVSAYLALGASARLRFLGAFASPILFAMGVFALMPNLDPPRGPKPEFIGGLPSLHATLILLSYGAFGLSAVAAFMYLTQEHNLKFHKLRAILSLLPPIQRLELATGRLLFAGFILLTVGLSLTPILLKEKYGVYFVKDPKILWSIFVWAVYLALLIMRWRFAQGGRRFAWGAIGAFTFVLLTFWGSYLLSTIHQP